MSLDLSLYRIEDDLLSLIQWREESAAEFDALTIGTPEGLELARAELAEQIKVIDDQITLYVGAEVRKVDGIAHHWRNWEAAIAAKKAEAKRLADAAKSDESRLDRLKSAVKAAMESFEWRAGKPRVLEGRLAKLYLKANGGKQAVEIHDASLVPDEYCMVTITFRADSAIVKQAQAECPQLIKPREPSLSLIAAALEKPCEPCGGKGGPVDLTAYGGGANEPCPSCGGTGKQGVPGARLADRGSQVELR